MSNKNSGGYAFPVYPSIHPTNSGMSLRDYFAAKAMQGMLADPSRDMYSHELAAHAYQMADEMLEAKML